MAVPRAGRYGVRIPAKEMGGGVQFSEKVKPALGAHIDSCSEGTGFILPSVMCNVISSLERVELKLDSTNMPLPLRV